MTVESVSSPAVCGGNWPPGFRFHPTDEELVLYYLKRKICKKKLKLNIIAELDVYKWDPEELPGLSLLRTGDRQWYFFSTRDRRYPNGARSNRATGHGYWKATGKDRNITSNSRSVGVKKTLVFYRGRAPTGLRTDWVMHEYTLDEEEFKRCQNVKDYYALYKVYKKSGSGPKNGEQYGAPFREEEWADDDDDVVKATKQQEVETLSRQLPAVTSFDVSGNDQFQLPLDDLEELLNECFVPEHDQSTLCGATPDPAVSTVDVVNSTQQDDLMATIDWALLGTPQNQQNDGSEMTYSPQNYTFEAQGCGDFLEIDDLIGPVPTVDVVNKPVEELSFEEMGGLSELDLYQDAAMFLRDMGSLDQGINEANDFDYGLVDQSSYQMLQQQQQQPNLVSADPNINRLWGNDALSWAESVQAPQPHPSGSSSDGSIVLNNGTQNQNQNGMEGGGGRMSQFSSVVWSFVESIPTNPAAASENALVNKALERMSSFGRVRVNCVTANVGAAAVVVRRRKSRGIVLLVYVVGVLGALFGVLIGFLRSWQRSVPA